MKKIITPFLATAIFLIGFNSCKKETTIIQEYNPNIGIYGTWRVTLAPLNNPGLKFIAFKSNKTLQTYSQSNGFNSSTSSSFTPFTDQVLADFFNYGSAVIYNYSMKGDTLYIESGSTLIKSVKTGDSDVANWATEVSIVDEITGIFTDRPYGIGFDGSNILLPDYNTSKITKINLATRIPSGDIDVNGSYPYTVEFDGTDIWVSSNGYDIVNRHPLAGGGILSTSPRLGAWVYGIAFDPAASQIWAFSGNEDSIYMFNKTGTSLISTRQIGNGFRDLAWSNGKLFITQGNYIYRVNTNGFTIEKTYKLKIASQIYGLAAIGNDFWLNIQGDRLVKVTLN